MWEREQKQERKKDRLITYESKKFTKECILGNEVFVLPPLPIQQKYIYKIYASVKYKFLGIIKNKICLRPIKVFNQGPQQVFKGATGCDLNFKIKILKTHTHIRHKQNHFNKPFKLLDA